MNFNPDLIDFILTVALSFLVGLETKAYKLQFHANAPNFFFGTARTFTFVGIIGFLFYKIDTINFAVYISGMIGLTLLYALFYYKKLLSGKQSILMYLVMLVVYSFGPITVIYPLWMPALIFVLIVFILNAKKSLLNFASGVDTYEFETLGKMVLLSAVILPLLPNQDIIPYLPLSPFKIWLIVVVISAISYSGYIVHKYLLPSKSFFLTGLIGGLYSSTATTVVLSKKAREVEANEMMTASIIAATSVMYIRLIILSLLFNSSIAKNISLPFLFFSFSGFILTFYYYKKGTKTQNKIKLGDKNPLELGTAFVFAIFFILMILATNFAIEFYGNNGLNMLSFIAGFADIDPFVLSLLAGKYAVAQHEIYAAIIISAGSNNILKAIYSLWFGSKTKTLHAFAWLIVLGIVTITTGLLI
jgi:uncharacterized membrane protein (DUF4010 family)